MLFIISQDGMKVSDRDRMMRYAKLPDSDAETISNLGYLGVQLTKKVIRDKQKQKKKKKSSEDIPDVMYELSRFVPRIKGILRSLVNNELSETEYPTLSDKSASSGAATSTTGESKKKKGAKAAPRWADKSKAAPTGPAAGGSSSAQDVDYVGASDADPRFLVFIAGGMTYSETRSIYEVSVSSSKNCYIGSTQFLTPPVFVHELSLLSKTPEEAEKLEQAYIKQQEEALKPASAPQKKGEAASAAAASTSS